MIHRMGFHPEISSCDGFENQVTRWRANEAASIEEAGNKEVDWNFLQDLCKERV